MLIPLWIIAVCELVRISQNERQLKMMEQDRIMDNSLKKDISDKIMSGLDDILNRK